MSDSDSIIDRVALRVLPCYNSNMDSDKKGDIELGRRIKTARGEMTQEELSEISGVSLSMIQKMEAGRLFGGKVTHYKLAKTLGITEAYLVYGQNQSGPKPQSRIPDMPEDPPQEEEPEYLVFLSTDENLPPDTRELMSDIIRKRYAEIKRNAEELRKIPPGINRPARINKPE